MDRTDGIAAIRAVVADIEAAFNGNDAERSVAHFADAATARRSTGTTRWSCGHRRGGGRV